MSHNIITISSTSPTESTSTKWQVREENIQKVTELLDEIGILDTTDKEIHENIRQMELRHKAEIEKLRAECEHGEKTDWREIRDKRTGQPVGMFKGCIHCGKIIETSKIITPIIGVKPNIKLTTGEKR